MNVMVAVKDSPGFAVPSSAPDVGGSISSIVLLPLIPPLPFAVTCPITPGVAVSTGGEVPSVYPPSTDDNE